MGRDRRLDVLSTDYHPAYVVWELTLRCDHACTHCGSRAAVARDDELSTAEAIEVARELVRLRAAEVVLIGGEAYLHDGFLEIVRTIASAGVRVTMTTGGRAVDAELSRRMRDAGLSGASVSVDGLQPTHDRMRALRGSFDTAMRALDSMRDAGLWIASNTNINRFNRDELEPLYDVLRARGIRSWQVQLTVPLGRAADRTEMILQPWDLLDVVPRIAALKKRAFDDGILVMPGNNLGYFGPEEALLRSTRPDGEDHWMGCQAGRYVLGIESDGAVKGCPSLQTRAYVGGNVRSASVEQIWKSTPELAFARTRTVDDLWGECRRCAFAAECLGGCSFTAHALFGRPGNNPYCHFRARTLAKRGLRERLVATDAAPGEPFDHGLFELVVEPLDSPDPTAATPRDELVRITRKASNRAAG